MIGIQTDKDELLIDGTIKCESEEDYYMILDELYRDRREEIENENFDWCSDRNKRKYPLCRCYGTWNCSRKDRVDFGRV